jgi:hypothetical protein
MELARTIRLNSLPLSLLNHLDSRDAAVWVLEPFVSEAGDAAVADVVKLPWRLALSESSDPGLIRALEETESSVDPLVRRRGFLQVVDTNPADVLLPPRSLPVYLLNGRKADATTGIAAMTRRLTMLDALRKAGVKELIVLAARGTLYPRS